MARKTPAAQDTSRKLANAKIWNGAIYSPGMEADLPEDFPMDGPHWADYEPDETPAPVRGQAAVNHASQAQQAMGASPEMTQGDITTEVNEATPPNTNVANARRAGTKKGSAKKGHR